MAGATDWPVSRQILRLFSLRALSPALVASLTPTMSLPRTESRLVGSLNASVRASLQAKYDVALERHLRNWIASVLDNDAIKLNENGADAASLHALLKSGTVLCECAPAFPSPRPPRSAPELVTIALPCAPVIPVLLLAVFKSDWERLRNGPVALAPPSSLLLP